MSGIKLQNQMLRKCPVCDTWTPPKFRHVVHDFDDQCEWVCSICVIGALGQKVSGLNNNLNILIKEREDLVRNVLLNIQIAGFDRCTGSLWYYDAKRYRVFVQGDETPPDQRGYDCASLAEAKRMLREEIIP